MSSSSWIGGINVDDFVKTLLKKEVDAFTLAENKGPLAQLNKQHDALSTQLSNYGSLQSLLKTFRTDLDKIMNFKSSYTLGLSDSSIAKAEITGTPSPGNHTLVVTQLATSNTIASTFNVTSKTDNLHIVEQLQISVGTTNLNIEIQDGDSLQDVLDKIKNLSSSKVTASIAATGDNQFQLLLSSTDTGQTNQLNITENPTGMNKLDITQTLTSAHNATFTYDGLSFDVSSNTNLIHGLSVTLLKAGTTNINVEENSQPKDFTSALQKIVDDYNAIDSFIEKAQLQTGKTDTGLSKVLISIQKALNESFAGTSDIKKLNELGIMHSKSEPFEVTRTDFEGRSSTYTYSLIGQLKLNTDILNDKLTADFADVQKVLTDITDGLFTKLNTDLQPVSGKIDKILNEDRKDNHGLHYLGIVPQTKDQLKSVDLQIDLENNKITHEKERLIVKYAHLNIMLVNLQSQSQYVSQQVSIWNSKNR